MIERDDALDQVRAAISNSIEGRGRTLVLTGVPGIGKTRMLDAATGLAGEAGMRTLRARGAEAEREFPFSGALQLLETASGTVTDLPASVLSGSAALARPVLEGVYLAGSGGPVASAVHGLFWLTVNLANEQPLALLVDDLHALDGPTLAYLLYLYRRIDNLRVLLIVATRPVDSVQRAEIAELAYGATTTELALLPLSDRGVAELVRSEFDPDADPDFCAACAKVSAGNPFYLKEALRSLRAEGAPATRDGARRLSDVEPHAIARSVLLRLARLDTSAHALARACAILGPGAPVSLAADVAGLSLEQTLRASDALAAASILEPEPPLRFVHALIGAALAADIPAGEQAALHARAADLLASEGAAPERIAAHLLGAAPARDQARVDVLVAAAGNALKAGMPGSAAVYLNRALLEPPVDRERRAAVLSLLTRAELGTDPAGAAAHLSEVRALGISGRAAAELQRELGLALFVQGDHPAAAAAFLEGAELLDAGDALARELTAWFISAGTFDQGTRSRGLTMAAELGRSPAALEVADSERAVVVQLCQQQIVAGRPLREVRDRLDQAWAGGELLRAETADGYSWMHASSAYALGGDLISAEAIIAEATRDAQNRGSVMALATASYARARVALWQGRVLDALAEVEAALEAHLRDGWSMYHGAARFVQAEALLALGELAAAERALIAAEDRRYAGSAELALLLYGRARVRLGQDRVREARADLERTREQLAALELRVPQLVPWWVPLAEALTRDGAATEAERVLVEGEQQAREAELPGILARTLVARARLLEADEALALLAEARTAARASQAELQVAEVQLATGAALRRAGQRRAAVTELRPALELANRLGARELESRIRDELAVAGARPRRAQQTGAEALTAAELRTARLAAQGLTNREIAEYLFVTPKTVEYHLRNAFMKLSVGSRRELAQALAGAGADTDATAVRLGEARSYS